MDADCVDTEKARLPQPRASFASRRRPSRSGRRRIAATRGVSGYFFLGETAFLPMHDLPEETARLSRANIKEKAHEVPEKKQPRMPSRGGERANLNMKIETRTETAGGMSMAAQLPAPWMLQWWCTRSGRVSRELVWSPRHDRW